MKKPDSYWDYAQMFKRHKKDCTIFFETGTHKGESVADALYLGFEKVISVEILPEYYELCLDKFKDDMRVNLFFGDSNEKMPEMLELVDKRALFWLDGHHGTGEPVWTDIQLLSTHRIKNHTIIIDDIERMYTEQIDELKQAILKVNPNYKFFMEPQAKCLKGKQNEGILNGHLVAYID